MAALLSLAPLALSAVDQPADFRSPEVAPDGTVTFRCFAPNAGSVAVNGLRRSAPLPMIKGESGIWSATIAGLAPDLYEYSFSIDGAPTLDPRNWNIKRWLVSANLVEVPGNPPALFAQRAVPHGTVHHHTIASAVAGHELGLSIYTPPGYDPRAETRYPVVVLLHGFGDDETAWLTSGRAHFIADNLLAEGRAQPCVIVMPYGHLAPLHAERTWDYYKPNLRLLERALLEETLPFVDAHYRTRSTANDRALVGLSMGGVQALGIGVNHPETFGWVGSFSASIPTEEFATLYPGAARPARERRLLFLGSGRSDSRTLRNEELSRWLRERGTAHEWQLTDGNHEWTVWRELLPEFLSRLFHD